MQARRGSPGSLWLIVSCLWLAGGCKDELDGKQAADPLEDPWVASLDTGGEEPATAEPEAAAATVEAPAQPAPAVAEGADAEGPDAEDPDPEDPQPSADPSAGANPSPSSAPTAAAAAAGSGGSKAPSPTPTPANADSPAPAEAPASPEPAPTPADTPAAAPTPPPSAAPTKPAEPPPLTVADLQGKFRYSGGATGEAARDAALEVTVNALASAIRGIARKRLRATNPIEQTVEIVVAGDKVTTTWASGVTITCVVDGGTCDSRDIEGNKLRARLRWSNGKLVQHMEGKGGARTVVYALSSDRKRLTVHTKITSDRLPEPMVYKLSYSRK